MKRVVAAIGLIGLSMPLMAELARILPTAVTAEATAALQPDGDAVIAAIDNGQRLFLLREDDGYWYPVGVSRNEILESLPAQVEVLRLHDGEALTVRVTELQPLDASRVEALAAERQTSGCWQPLGTVLWGQGGLLGPTGEQSPIYRRLPLGGLRFKAPKSPKEGAIR